MYHLVCLQNGVSSNGISPIWHRRINYMDVTENGVFPPNTDLGKIMINHDKPMALGILYFEIFIHHIWKISSYKWTYQLDKWTSWPTWKMVPFFTPTTYSMTYNPFTHSVFWTGVHVFFHRSTMVTQRGSNSRGFILSVLLTGKHRKSYWTWPFL